MLVSFSMLELPHKSYFGQIIKKLNTSAFLETKIGVRSKVQKNGNIVATLFDFKKENQFREIDKIRGSKCN